MRDLNLGFQESATPLMEGIVDLHNQVMFYLVITFAFVIYIFGSVFIDFYKPLASPVTWDDLRWREVLLKGNGITHGMLLELVWTITPSIILFLIALPSFSLLYSMDEVIDPKVTIKAIGHQWYWSYEYGDYNSTLGGSLNFDSYMIATSELAKGQHRLLEVDNPIVLPVDTHIRILVLLTTFCIAGRCLL
jgi:cytochrome c oxidase subunit 2